MMQFLTPERFDLLAKYIYTKYHDLGIQTNFHQELYDEHIRVFNGGWEFPGTKNTIADFRYTFDELIKSLKVHGFDDNVSVVPLGNNGILFNGAHRVAACLWLGLNIKTRTLRDRAAPCYDWKFFRTYQLHVPQGLRAELCDTMALQYALLKSNECRMVIVFPVASVIDKSKEFEEEIQNFGRVVYQKRIVLNSAGFMNLLEECYYREPWLNNHGLKAKFKLCWGSKLEAMAYLFEPHDLGMMKFIKTRLRKMFMAGQHALHINDTAEETLRLAKMAFNDNSLHWLNHAKQTRHQWTSNENLVFRFSEDLKKRYQPDERERFMVDGSMVLSIYGLREANDLDYIHFNAGLKSSPRLVQSHNHEYPKEAIDDLIFNPKNYFYAHGVKFMAPDALIEFKKRRNESKDVFDIKLLENLLS